MQQVFHKEMMYNLPQHLLFIGLTHRRSDKCLYIGGAAGAHNLFSASKKYVRMKIELLELKDATGRSANILRQQM